MTDHFKKTATAVVVVLICFEMLGELVYTRGKDRYLYLGRARVAFMCFVSGDYFLLLFFGHFFITFQIIFRTPSDRRVIACPKTQRAVRVHTDLLLYTKNPRL